MERNFYVLTFTDANYEDAEILVGPVTEDLAKHVLKKNVVSCLMEHGFAETKGNAEGMYDALLQRNSCAYGSVYVSDRSAHLNYGDYREDFRIVSYVPKANWYILSFNTTSNSLAFLHGPVMHNEAKQLLRKETQKRMVELKQVNDPTQAEALYRRIFDGEEERGDIILYPDSSELEVGGGCWEHIQIVSGLAI